MWPLLLLVWLVPLLAACDHEQAENGRSLGIELVWGDDEPGLPPGFIGSGAADSSQVDVRQISVWFHPADGSPAVEYRFSDPQELALQRFDLPAGEYRLFATVNLLPPYIDEYGPAQSRAFTDGKEHFITLEEPDGSPDPAYCYENKVVITSGGVQQVKVSPKEILAELTFVVKGVPRGTVAQVSVENAAAGITPRFDDAVGEMVAEPSELKVPVGLPATVSTDGIVTLKNFRLLSSAKGETETLIRMRLVYPSTKHSDFEIHAPVMRMGGKYYIALDFADLSPQMYLWSVRVDGWTETWAIEGAVTDPDD